MKRNLRRLLENYGDDFRRDFRELFYAAVLIGFGFLLCFFLYEQMGIPRSKPIHVDVNVDPKIIVLRELPNGGAK